MSVKTLRLFINAFNRPLLDIPHHPAPFAGDRERVLFPIIMIEKLQREITAVTNRKKVADETDERGDARAGIDAIGVGGFFARQPGRVVVHVQDAERGAVELLRMPAKSDPLLEDTEVRPAIRRPWDARLPRARRRLGSSATRSSTRPTFPAPARCPAARSTPAACGSGRRRGGDRAPRCRRLWAARPCGRRRSRPAVSPHPPFPASIRRRGPLVVVDPVRQN